MDTCLPLFGDTELMFFSSQGTFCSNMLWISDLNWSGMCCFEISYCLAFRKLVYFSDTQMFEIFSSSWDIVLNLIFSKRKIPKLSQIFLKFTDPRISLVALFSRKCAIKNWTTCEQLKNCSRLALFPRNVEKLGCLNMKNLDRTVW